MKALLVSLLKDLILDGLPKLGRAISDYFRKKKREKDREEKLKKYEESGDPKDLADLGDSLNDK